MNNLSIFELALLFALAEKYPCLYSHIDKLCVDSRECTGVGQYIFFKYQDEIDLSPILENILSVDKMITTPGIEHGLGFIGNLEDGKLSNLEIFVYGSDDWDCSFRDFQLKDLNKNSIEKG